MKARITIGVLLLVVLIAELFLGTNTIVSAGDHEIFTFSITNVCSKLNNMADSE